MDLHVLLHLFIPPCKKNPTFIVFIAILHFLFTTGERKRMESYLGRSLDLTTVRKDSVWGFSRLLLSFILPSFLPTLERRNRK